MDDLSREARDALDAFRDTLNPEPGFERRTWEVLRQRMADEEASAMETSHMRRRRRRQLRWIWRTALRAIVLPVMAVIAVTWLGSIFIGTYGESAMLQDARDLIDRGSHARAYNVLADHARRYPTRSSAERRMTLLLEVWCGMELPDRAEEELERYLELNPESEHAPRLANVCPDQPGVDSPDPE